MDVHVHGNPRLHYMLNGYKKAKDDGLQFLSVEEKECILFFEETIDSLEEGFDDTTGLPSRKTTPSDSLRSSSSSALSSVPRTNVSPNLMEHDIIDLVRSPTNFTVQDFSNLAVTPEPHFETVPKKDPVVSSLISSPAAHEENNHTPPPGSVPTPVVIASKLSEHQGTGGITPSTLLGRRRSLESKREPPMHPRNPHLPSKISLTRGYQEPSPHLLATAAVSAQERRSQVLANLPEGSHPLEGGEPACMRNVPMRSVSFNDMTPEKSRIEALSKLGLMVGRANQSAASVGTKGNSSSTSPNSSIYKASGPPSNSPIKVSGSASSPNSSSNKASISTHAYTSNNVSVNSNPGNSIGQKNNSNPSFTRPTSSSDYEAKLMSELSSNNFNYYGGKTAIIAPVKDTDVSVNKERRPSSAEVKHTDFNNYGGKSIVLNPSVKAESVPSPPTASKSAETQFNSYGGRSKVINPSGNTEVPNGVTAHGQSTTNTVPATTYHGDATRSRYPSEQNSYDAKPKVPTPSQTDQPIVRTRPSTLPPPTAPRPLAPTVSLRTRPDPVPPEILSKPAPSFRNQGVTVQFSGKGTTGEARQDALRRLGLLKKTH